MPSQKSIPSLNLHRNDKIRTSCPNPQDAAHNNVTDDAPVQSVAQKAVLDELERLFRSPSGLRKTARSYAWRRGCDAEDLLSEAILHALEKGTWHGGVANRLDGILSSKSYSLNRARSRQSKSGGTATSFDDAPSGIYTSATSPRTLTPHQVVLRDAQRRACTDAIEAIVSGDQLLDRLVDGLGQGMSGAALQKLLCIDAVGLGSLRKKLKRRAINVLQPYVRQGQLDVDLLLPALPYGDGHYTAGISANRSL